MISQPSHTLIVTLLRHSSSSQASALSFIMGGLYLALLLVTCSFGESVCVEYAAKSSPLLQGQCPSLEERERVRAEITADVRVILSAVHTCDGSPGWRRVGFVNMTDPSQDCPPGLNITSHPIRTCGSSHDNDHGCSSTSFSVGGIEYGLVCGRIRAYQYGRTFAFNNYLRLGRTIEESYADGVSLTHGVAGERQHIWTFAAGFSEVSNPFVICPCDLDNVLVTSPPPYVEGDYFCETGNNDAKTNYYIFFESDPLWDGEGCGLHSTCCQFNDPPWFTRTLPTTTTDDIELRLCHFLNTTAADVPIELIELYVK